MGTSYSWSFSWRASSESLSKGETVLAGTAYGRIRMMYDHEGQVVSEVTPGRPVQLQGFDEVPMAGEAFHVVRNEREVLAGYECGIGLEGFNDIKRGDVIEAYVEEEHPQSI